MVVSNMNHEGVNWFYIKHTATGQVIASSNSCYSACIDTNVADEKHMTSCVRSQVFVTKPKYTDGELWCWDDNYLRNKKTDLVLDIRKGRLRLLEDTEICLYYKKQGQTAQNQLWAVRDAEAETPTYSLARNTGQELSHGKLIYSTCNCDWILGISTTSPLSPLEQPELQENANKLVLLPYHPDSLITQKWEFVLKQDFAQLKEQQEAKSLLTLSNRSSSISLSDRPTLFFNAPQSSESSITTEDSFTSTASPPISLEFSDGFFARGLTPAKRNSSQSSLSLSSSRKASYEELNTCYCNPHIPL